MVNHDIRLADDMNGQITIRIIYHYILLCFRLYRHYYFSVILSCFPIHCHVPCFALAFTDFLLGFAVLSCFTFKVLLSPFHFCCCVLTFAVLVLILLRFSDALFASVHVLTGHRG